MKVPTVKTKEGLKPITCLSDDMLVSAYIAAGGSAIDIVRLLQYAVFDAAKAGAILRRCLEGNGALVVVYHGTGQTPPLGASFVGSVPDGALYFLPKVV